MMYDPESIHDRINNAGTLRIMPPAPHRPQKTVSMGICLGASSISVAVIAGNTPGAAPSDRDTIAIIRHAVYPHAGDPRGTLVKVLDGFDPWCRGRVAVTGRRLRGHVNLTAIAEPEAVGLAYRHLRPDGIDCPAIVSAGGETFMVYVLDATGNIANVITGNKCASGTGEFFLQQLRRMDVSIEETERWAETETPYPVSGRCSVFCKSDCTHATNKGVPRSQVAAGLCRMMAGKVLELLARIPKRHVMLVGGTARNRMMVTYLQQQIDGLIIPDAAPYFEALGTALWALDHPVRPYAGKWSLFVDGAGDVVRLPALSAFQRAVTFKTMRRGRVRDGDVCLLGLDVGSTTTKAVLIRRTDETLLASIYLRTNGDPVGAARRCYGALLEIVRQSADPSRVRIIGLGVCGSGRQIAGIHAGTDAIINEIIAHCTAAVHFDPAVDTLFEIGGQDAKYTHITTGVASNYAMNEACSAGTGSFLEESAHETLGIAMPDIAEQALRGCSPPNFNDQCAAFIASDIKTAIHEGIGREDIVAGLVFAVCRNYITRVVGNRPVGRRIFMQGGVCYNRAVPMAMAALVEKTIVVPPEPGLMGAFGVALEVDKRLTAGRLEPAAFDLDTLRQRRATFGRRFVCRGGGNGCDRRCAIDVVHIAGRRIPFGGACNRYYNRQRRIRVDADALDGVRQRERILMAPVAITGKRVAGGQHPLTVGLNRSFLFHAYFPLYAAFFQSLGIDLRVPGKPSEQGICQQGAPFCYPGELSHGYFHELIAGAAPPDDIFLPQVKSLPSACATTPAVLCPLVQGEPYFLRTTFRRQLAHAGIPADRQHTPVLDMTAGLAGIGDPMATLAQRMGYSRKQATAAFEAALAIQNQRDAQIAHLGRRMLRGLADAPESMAVVIFGRPYNAWTGDANMGIPRKLASRGVPVLPMDALPCSDRSTESYMYWGMGQRILAAARQVAENGQLFGVYITNFSCGPDSLLVGYFRNIMGRKPSLTLELDSHTADAGLETRIEAFLDVVAAWRLQQRPRVSISRPASFTPARIETGTGRIGVRTSAGRWHPLTDPRVTLLFPSMGRRSTEALAAVFTSRGIRSVAAPPADHTVLQRGLANVSGKACLPLILTTGTLLAQLERPRPPENVLVYFMATGDGPCRFGQYRVFLESLIKQNAIPDVALFSLNSADGYRGLDQRLHRDGWRSVVIADTMEDIRAMLLANATDPAAALDRFEEEWHRLVAAVRSGTPSAVTRQLERTSRNLAAIALKQPIEAVPRILLAGEIFVRRDDLSRRFLTEYLAHKGFACICAPVGEWLHYTDWLVATGRSRQGCLNGWQKVKVALKRRVMTTSESRIRRQLARTGLIPRSRARIEETIRHARPYIAPDHQGEAILTIGSALDEIAESVCGVIAIGPFGCMPNRLAESILRTVMTKKDKLAQANDNPMLAECLTGMDALPFLAIESDGSPFPQLIEARLEAFCLQARRLHARMRGVKNRPMAWRRERCRPLNSG